MTRGDAYPALVLAYIGDAYFELLVRKTIAGNGDCDPAGLSKRAMDFVTAKAQSTAVENLLPLLTEAELAAYKRGRNARVNHSPRSASAVDYHRATGLEALFGWLCVGEEHDRANELFMICFNETLNPCGDK